MANIVEDIKNILEFYQALGFERLPINLPSPPFSKRGKERLEKGGNRGIKEAALKALREEIGDCKRCKLSNGRTNIVFGEVDPGARLMFIGEAPGREEDLQGRPFVGDAGVVLTRLIEKMGFKREDVYIANIVKCRPPMNRDPEMDEIEKCRAFLERQIEIINPDVIMSLGRISAQTLIGNAKLKITAIRGKFFDYKGIPLMPTFHPAYLIRNPKDKWLTWDDAQKVLEKLKSRE
ncbi:MAG: uracil-DNA glycosylase [Thermodesulfovibrio sp. RBG_19FT_COMBO_42_12]|nr:MAG: uracil-DNA glycosylase [Thermodesulfovibrio sp. RBG_19FT_COMBO_42_12]